MKQLIRSTSAGLAALCALVAVSNAFAAKPPKSAPTKAVVKAVGAAGSYAKVESILKARCVGCHNGPTGRAGVNLTSYASITGGKFKGKPLVVPKKPTSSQLVLALHGTGMAQMPPGGHGLPDPDIKTIENWILKGAQK